MKKDETVSVATEGERSSTGVAPEVKCWSANRKKEVVLRLMRGEPVDAFVMAGARETIRFGGGGELHSAASFQPKRKSRQSIILFIVQNVSSI